MCAEHIPSRFSNAIEAQEDTGDAVGLGEMEYHHHHHQLNYDQSHGGASLSNYDNEHHHNNHHPHNNDNDPMHSWWESVSKARSRIHTLLSLLPTADSPSLSSIADSDRPARSLLDSFDAYSAVSCSLSSSLSGSGDDPFCHWIYDTFQSSDPDLRLVVLSLLPLIAGLYLSRVHSSSALDPSSPSLAGFEAVLLAVYTAEAKARGGKPLIVSIPDLSQPSLYHTPRPTAGGSKLPAKPSVGVLSPPLEPHLAVKSTKRGCIVGVALDCFYKQISQMPSWSKLELCQFTTAWAGQDCPCAHSLDSEATHGDDVLPPCSVDTNNVGDHEIVNVADSMERVRIKEGTSSEYDRGVRIPLPWEMLQPVLRILGHCLLAPLNSQEVKDAAAVAVRRLYARASHDLVPQAILATRSLIQIDNRGRAAARAAIIAAACSKTNTPTKAKKPEVLLASK
ncbi:hypothetical protein Dimus_003509 [Dionaea muscipula]